MRVETRESGGVVGPAKWAAVGALGGAAIVSVVGAIVLRQPHEIVAAPPSPAPLHAFVQRVDPSTPPEASPSGTSSPSPAQTEAPMTIARAEKPPALAPEPNAEPKSERPREPLPIPPSPPPSTPTPESPKPVVPVPKPAVPKVPATVGKININKATQAELELLPRVGPALAQRIIEYRSAHGPFKHINDLDKVKGIGAKTIEKLKPLVSVE